MNVFIVSPSPEILPLGNTITAARWTEILRGLGHRVSVATQWKGEEADLLIALHARRSNPEIEKFRATHPNRLIVAALTGTDLYVDLRHDASARRSLVLADRIVALQNQACDELDEQTRRKLRVIYQSAVPPAVLPKPVSGCFEACVLSHLRDVKDPLRAAVAARELPSASQVRIVHAGRALNPVWAGRARAEEAINPRYSWIGELPHDAAMEVLARSRLLILSSELEGGANVIAEAVVSGVPVLCSRIPGNIGMLGADYPGYFQAHDTDALRGLLARSETGPEFLRHLKTAIERLKDRFAPARERQTWHKLMEELAVER